VKKLSVEHSKKINGLCKEAMESLTNYEWPGNVRELENLMERVIALTSNEFIEADELPLSFKNTSKINRLKDSILSGQVSLSKAEEEFEKGIILDALKRTKHIQSHAAEMLGISRRILKYKMDKLGINQSSKRLGR
jgi:DNA-binding NtrC family response regulator